MAHRKRQLRDIVIVLPGIMGSVLEGADGLSIWTPKVSAFWNAITRKSLDRLRLEQDHAQIEAQDDGIVATSLMPDAHLIPWVWKIDGYSRLTRAFDEYFALKRGLNTDSEPCNYLEFPYDWRRDCRVAARLLHGVVQRKLRAWREHSGASDAKIIFVCHSLGGLVARYFLEVLGGWQDCRALITFGTPFRGSLNAVNALANGVKLLSLDVTETLRSFTSVYQLLPIYGAIKQNENIRRVAELADIGIDKRKAESALAFHREIESQVALNRTMPGYSEFKVFPFVGIHQPTFQSATAIENRVEMSYSAPLPMDSILLDGDGTVPYVSAIPIEDSDSFSEIRVSERHASLHVNKKSISILLEKIERMQARGLAAYRQSADETVGSAAALSMNLLDMYAYDDQIAIKVDLVNGNRDYGDIDVELTTLSGVVLRTKLGVKREDKWQWRLEVDGLEPGTYRIAIAPATKIVDSPMRISDLFVVE